MINLLELVLPAIHNVVGDSGDFEYCTYLGMTINEMGVSVPSYSAWKTCKGSVQPMAANTMEHFGLSSAKRGIQVWGSIDFNTLDTQDHPDKVRHPVGENGRVYIVNTCTDWYLANGWKSFACTEDKRERDDSTTASNVKPVKDEASGSEVGTASW